MAFSEPIVRASEVVVDSDLPDTSQIHIFRRGGIPTIDIMSDRFIPASSPRITMSADGARAEILIHNGNKVFSIETILVPSVSSSLVMGGYNPTDARLEFNATKETILFLSRLPTANVPGLGQRSVIFNNGNGLLYAGFDQTVETWRTLTLPVGWTAVDPCQARVYPDGVVRCRGTISASVNPIPNGTVLFTLPPHMCPPNALLLPAVFNNSAQHGRFVVRANGDVEIYEAPNDGPALNSISFAID